jgi:hypothetical protein
MSKIILRSESGKWTYETTTDDAIFAPILGSMMEAGVALEEELVIPGALGEALEKGWKYIELLRSWEKWEDEYDKCMLPSDVQRELPTMPSVVLYKKIEVLSKALSLPYGWESHTVIDTSFSVQERTHHMEQSMAYLFLHPESVIAVRKRMSPVLRQLDEDVGGSDTTVSLLAPFYRNVWLTKGIVSITMAEVLTYLDWELVRSYFSNEFYAPVLNLANRMLGEPDSMHGIYGLDVPLRRIDNKIKLSVTFNETDKCVGELYTKLLYNIPEDVDPMMLGMEPILKDQTMPLEYRLVCLRNGSNYVPVSDLVWWINTVIIKRSGSEYYRCEVTLEHVTPIRHNMFDMVAEDLGNAIGIYAMRRILLSLRCYVQGLTSNQRQWVYRVNVGPRDSNTTRRAELFIQSINKWMEKNSEGDEGVRCLGMGDK